MTDKKKPEALNENDLDEVRGGLKTSGDIQTVVKGDPAKPIVVDGDFGPKVSGTPGGNNI